MLRRWESPGRDATAPAPGVGRRARPCYARRVRILFVTATRIGDAVLSTALLGHLTRWVQQPRFTVRYRWTAGTIAMWDNRCTQHHVLNDFEGERVIQRVTVMGDHPAPAVELPRWEPHGSRTATFWRDTEMRTQLKAQRNG